METKYAQEACALHYKQEVRVIWQKAASPHHMDGSIVFARLCQHAPPSNTWFLAPIQDCILNSISIGSAIFAQFMADSLCMGLPFLPQNCPFAREDLDPHLINRSFSPPECTSQMTSVGSAISCRAHNRDRQTDRPTYRPRYSVCNNRMHLRTYYCDAAYKVQMHTRTHTHARIRS